MSADRSLRLLVCLDGLDELPARNDGRRSVLDFLPASEDLEAGIFILLTSRPAAESPEWIARELGSRAAGWDLLDVTADDAGYLRLLREYWDEHMQRLLDGTVCAALERAALEPTPHTTGSRASWKKQYGDAWKKACQRTGVAPRPWAPWIDALVATEKGRLEGLFDVVLERSDGRFRFFAYVVDRLSNRTMRAGEIDALHTGDGLLGDLDEWLKRRLPAKLHQLGRRLLVALAAADEVHAWELENDVIVEAEPRGVSLEVLNGMVHEVPDGGAPVSVRLLFVLYALMPVLSTWTAGVETKQVRLGLHGLVCSRAVLT